MPSIDSFAPVQETPTAPDPQSDSELSPAVPPPPEPDDLLDLLEQDGDSPEDFLAWMDGAISSTHPELSFLADIAEPAAPCVPLTTEALTPYDPSRYPPSLLRSVVFAHEISKRGPFSLRDACRWAGDDVPGIVGVYLVAAPPSHPPMLFATPYGPLVDPTAGVPMVFGSDQEGCIDRARGFAESLVQTGLGPEHFAIRILPLDELYTEAVRKSLDKLYQPVWYMHDGFLSRKNKPDPTRLNAMPSDFDALHPGRPGAGRRERRDRWYLRDRLEAEVIQCRRRADKVELYLRAFDFLGAGR